MSWITVLAAGGSVASIWRFVLLVRGGKARPTVRLQEAVRASTEGLADAELVVATVANPTNQDLVLKSCSFLLGKKQIVYPEILLLFPMTVQPGDNFSVPLMKTELVAGLKEQNLKGAVKIRAVFLDALDRQHKSKCLHLSL